MTYLIHTIGKTEQKNHWIRGAEKRMRKNGKKTEKTEKTETGKKKKKEKDTMKLA